MVPGVGMVSAGRPNVPRVASILRPVAARVATASPAQPTTSRQCPQMTGPQPPPGWRGLRESLTEQEAVMAMGNFVVTADTTVTAGAVTRDSADGNGAGTGSAAGLLYAAIGAGNLRAAVAGDHTGRDGISN
jgi:hypothetical protein